MEAKYKVEDDDLFVRTPRSWYDDLEAGRMRWLDKEILEWLHAKANHKRGKISRNWSLLALELKDLLDDHKFTNHVDAVQKAMMRLRKQQKLWYRDHRGSRSKVEIELADFRLKKDLFADISYRFQQNSSRGSANERGLNRTQPAEQKSSQQRSFKSKDQEIKPTNEIIESTSSGTLKIDRKYKERKKDLNNFPWNDDERVNQLKENVRRRNHDQEA